MLFGLEAKIIGGLLLAALLAGAVLMHDKHEREIGAEHERLAVAAATAAQAASDAAETSRRLKAQEGILHDATVQADAARADAARAAASARSLRQQLGTFVAHARSADPAASGVGSHSDDPIGLLATLFGRIDDAAGRYSAEADANWIGWDTCVKSYDSLKVKP